MVYMMSHGVAWAATRKSTAGGSRDLADLLNAREGANERQRELEGDVGVLGGRRRRVVE